MLAVRGLAASRSGPGLALPWLGSGPSVCTVWVAPGSEPWCGTGPQHSDETDGRGASELVGLCAGLAPGLCAALLPGLAARGELRS